MAEFGRVTGTVGLGRRTRWMLSIGVSATLVAFFAPGAAASSQHAAAQKSTKQVPSGKIAASQIRTSSDKALQKLDPKLRKAYEKHDGASVAVFVSVVGDPRAVARSSHGAHTTKSGTLSLVVGQVPANQLVKLAADSKVLAVRQVTFRRDGTPVAIHRAPAHPAERRGQGEGGRRRPRPATCPTPTHRPAGVDVRQVQEAQRARRQDPQLHPGLEGRLHRRGHDRRRVRRRHRLVAPRPDRRQGRARPTSGWPAAFDPFGTLQWLAAPDQIDRGPELVRAHDARRPARARTATARSTSRRRPVRRATWRTRPGPTRTPTRFPASWSKSGNVRLGSHPDDYSLDFFGERPAFLVTDPNTAGVYDTIYVDLNDDYSFADEKPVTKAVAAVLA